MVVVVTSPENCMLDRGDWWSRGGGGNHFQLGMKMRALQLVLGGLFGFLLL